MTAPALLDALRAALAHAEGAPTTGWAEASDPELDELVRITTGLRQAAERHAALGAGEVVRRSGPDRGSTGFAQRAGHRTAEEFLRARTGVSGRDAATTARVGTLAVAGGVIGDAVRDGRLSVASADAIRAGLGAPNDAIPAAVLDQAARRLCEEAATLDPDRLHRRAREVRDELDEVGVADRERAQRTARSLRLVRQPDGMTRIVWLLDPESAAIATVVYDRATSPRRGGPRFVDPAARASASRIADDDRTTEQLASDAFTELLRQTATVDRTQLVGGEEPAVRVLVPASVLRDGAGHGVLESGETIALSTVQRLACAGGILPVVLDRVGQVVDLGRRQRLYSRAQRRALAARDGGCMWPGCERPSSWTEAHHIRSWSEGGRTDLVNGILLCRHHHLRLHDERWRITRRAGRYWLDPPPGSERSGALLETKSRAVREMLRTG